MRAFLLAAALAASSAVADPYDFKLYQLGEPGCSGRPACSPSANAHFRVFAREFGAALGSVNLMPAETLGHAGFAFNPEISVVNFQPGGDFVMPTTGKFDAPMLIPSVHMRKGLPWSFEAGARVAWVEKSRMAAGTIEAKWAVNEGFAYLPDIGVRGYGTRLFNTRDFGLTVAGLDIGISHQFAIGGMVTLTPYAGWNLVWVAADSNNIDFNPTRTRADAEASSAAQLSDTTVFDEVKLAENAHNRFYGGLRFIGGAVMIAAEVSYSSLGRFNDVTTNSTVAMPDLLTFNGTIGLDF